MVCLVAGGASADLSGPYDGRLSAKRSPERIDAAASLTQAGRALTGTLVLGGPDATLAGAYAVSGTTTGRKLRLAGINPGGARLQWRAVVTSAGAAGRLRLRGAVRLAGRLTLTRRPAGGDASQCDAIFTQNEAFFTAQVMDAVLVPVCAACHVAGGQAQATRLQVVRGDPLATARTVALLVDPAAPATSLLVTKPTAAVPHGGGQQLPPGGAQAQDLVQWATLVGQGNCVVAGGGSSPIGQAFAQNCAGCHGADGAGGATAPDVRCATRSLLADAVRRGRGAAMPPVAISSADLTAIATALDPLCSHRPADVYAANCAGCHGPTAGGGRNGAGVAGPNIRCSDEFGEALRGGEGMPAFPSFGAGEVSRLASYVRGFCGLGGGGDD